jgi:Nucleotidyl transferase AbiEii toxin, Type IV TA system
MLRLDTLPAATAKVFAHLYSEPLLNGFTLIGGTALSLQIGHRQSEDMEFYRAGEQLPSRTINAVLANAGRAGFAVRDMLSPTQLSQTRINYAVDLDDWVQDWAVGGVKVTFSVFNGYGAQMRAIAAYPRVADVDSAAQGATSVRRFGILGIEGLFAAKSCLLTRSARSRDLFDLYTLMNEHGYSVRQLFDVIRRIDPTANADHHRDVLRGLIPLDAADEGFAGIGVSMTLDALYAFFEARISEYEREEARRIVMQARANPGGA